MAAQYQGSYTTGGALSTSSLLLYTYATHTLDVEAFPIDSGEVSNIEGWAVLCYLLVDGCPVLETAQSTDYLACTSQLMAVMPSLLPCAVALKLVQDSQDQPGAIQASLRKTAGFPSLRLGQFAVQSKRGWLLSVEQL